VPAPIAQVGGNPGVPAEPESTVKASVSIPQHEVNQKVEVMPK
jgi:hypothetical protein